MSLAIVHPVTIDGVAFRLTFKFGSLRLFERELGKPVGEVFGFLDGGMAETELDAAAMAIPLEVWSAFFWAVLQPAHVMTREASDDLVDKAGLGQVVRWLLGGFAAYNAGDPALLELVEKEAEGNASAPAKARKNGKNARSS